MNTSRESIIVLDADLVVVKANVNYYHIFGQYEEEIVGSEFGSIQNGQWNDINLKSSLLSALHKGLEFKDFKLQLAEPNDRCKAVTLSSRKLNIPGVAKDFILVIIDCQFSNDDFQKDLNLITTG